MTRHTIRQFLDSHGVRYTSITHAPTYTALATARAAHLPETEIAKTVMVELDGEMAMAVVPASRRVDIKRLGAAAGASVVHVPTEGEFRDQFDGCEPGAMPPFGCLYGMRVFVDDTLTRDERIAFNAGSHEELIEMSFGDYSQLVHPVVANISSPLYAVAE